MALVAADLADKLRADMGFPSPVSPELLAWATGVVGELQSNAVVEHLTGTVTGITAPGAPLSAGSAVGGVISGLSGASMANLVVAAGGYPDVSPELQDFCQAIATHIMSNTVSFIPGTITGTCTSSPVSPGSLAAGAGSGGQIIGLSGTALASLVVASVGYPGIVPELEAFCTAITGYLTDNAEVEYGSGQVTGQCPAGGGPLGSGAASGGIIV